VPRVIYLAALLGAGALGAAWYLNGGSESGEAEGTSYIAAYDAGEPEPVVDRRGPGRKVKTLSGLQTTVPDTLGYDERTAVYALEDGGFRVRVMYRKVSDPSQEGVVVQQLPRGNLTRRVGWIVTIVVGMIR
jgi:hypothetical protein